MTGPGTPSQATPQNIQIRGASPHTTWVKAVYWRGASAE